MFARFWCYRVYFVVPYSFYSFDKHLCLVLYVLPILLMPLPKSLLGNSVQLLGWLWKMPILHGHSVYQIGLCNMYITCLQYSKSTMGAYIIIQLCLTVLVLLYLILLPSFPCFWKILAQIYYMKITDTIFIWYTWMTVDLWKMDW